MRKGWHSLAATEKIPAALLCVILCLRARSVCMCATVCVMTDVGPCCFTAEDGLKVHQKGLDIKPMIQNSSNNTGDRWWNNKHKKNPPVFRTCLAQNVKPHRQGLNEYKTSRHFHSNLEIRALNDGGFQKCLYPFRSFIYKEVDGFRIRETAKAKP